MGNNELYEIAMEMYNCWRFIRYTEGYGTYYEIDRLAMNRILIPGKPPNIFRRLLSKIAVRYYRAPITTFVKCVSWWWEQRPIRTRCSHCGRRIWWNGWEDETFCCLECVV